MAPKGHKVTVCVICRVNMIRGNPRARSMIFRFIQLHPDRESRTTRPTFHWEAQSCVIRVVATEEGRRFQKTYCAAKSLFNPSTILAESSFHCSSKLSMKNEIRYQSARHLSLATLLPCTATARLLKMLAPNPEVLLRRIRLHSLKWLLPEDTVSWNVLCLETPTSTRQFSIANGS